MLLTHELTSRLNVKISIYYLITGCMVLEPWELNMNIKSIKAKITVCFCLLLVLLFFISYEGYFGPDKVLARNAQIDEMQSILQNESQARRYEKNMIIRRDVERKNNSVYFRN